MVNKFVDIHLAVLTQTEHDRQADGWKSGMRLTETERAGVLAVFLRRFTTDRIHLITLPRRYTGVEQLGLDCPQLDALNGRVVEAVHGRVE